MLQSPGRRFFGLPRTGEAERYPHRQNSRLLFAIDAGLEFVHATAFADDDLVRPGCTGAQRRPSSESLACCHSDSINSNGASCRDVPQSFNFCSRKPKRRRNFRLVRRSADSGSTERRRARFTITKKRSPISSSIRACSSAGIWLVPEAGENRKQAVIIVPSVLCLFRQLLTETVDVWPVKPMCAAFELIFPASINAGILEDTASRRPADASTAVPFVAARSLFSSFLMASQFCRQLANRRPSHRRIRADDVRSACC